MQTETLSPQERATKQRATLALCRLHAEQRATRRWWLAFLAIYIPTLTLIALA